MNTEDLYRLLLKYNINTKEWSNQKGTKTIEDLQEEITLGESTLEVINNKLTRVVKIASIEVKVKLGKKLFTLVEDKQIFFTGLVRKRGLRNLAEKIKEGETPEFAAYRGLKEEIGLNFERELIFKGETQTTKCSPSYPQLNSLYNIFNYEIILEHNDLEIIRFSEYQKQEGIISLFSLE